MKWCPLECWGQESNHYLGQQSVDECVDWNQQTKYPWFKYCSKLWVQIYSRKPVPGSSSRTCLTPIREFSGPSPSAISGKNPET